MTALSGSVQHLAAAVEAFLWHSGFAQPGYCEAGHTHNTQCLLSCSDGGNIIGRVYGATSAIKSEKVVFDTAEHKLEAIQRVMMTPQADDFDFIRKRMQELVKERHRAYPGTVEPTSENDIVNRQILNHLKHIRRRLPGENPSS